MRDGFRDVVAGWMRIGDIHALKAKIDLAASWKKAHGPLSADEEETVKQMITAFCRMGIRTGEFTIEHLNNFLERQRRKGGENG